MATVAALAAASVVLVSMGALVPAYVWDGQYWRLFTAMFLHASVFDEFLVRLAAPGRLFQLFFLQSAPLEYLLERRDAQHHEHVEAGEQVGVVGGESIIDCAAPGAVRVLFCLQCIDRLIQFVLFLRACADAPAFEEHDVDGRIDGLPFRLRLAFVERLVERGQCDLA